MSLTQSTDVVKADISNVLTEVNQKIADLEKRSDSKSDKVDQSQLLNDVVSQAQTKSDIEFMCDSIMKMSNICLNKINDLSQKFLELNAEVDEISGTLGIVKETKGLALLDEYAAEINQDNVVTEKLQKRATLKPPPPYVLTPSKVKEITYPGENLQINIRALDIVGRNVEEQKMADLIIQIRPNENRGEFWSRQADYFIKSVDLPQNDTSFNALYA